MRLGILKEIYDGEFRVAITPNIAQSFIKMGLDVLLEKDAGIKAGFLDKDYLEVGVKIVSKEDIYTSDIIVKLNAPAAEELKLFKDGVKLICHMDSFNNKDLFPTLIAKKIESYALELMPRISRAQACDILSSQSNLVGYQSVIASANFGNLVFPMMMTSAGSIPPARVFVIGVGVAGLQAIATAKRLGAMVSAYDVRIQTKEQVESLGAKFVEVDLTQAQSGVYAQERTPEYQAKEKEVLLNHIAKQDVIITTALVMGKKAPILIDEEMFSHIKKGAIVVDLAVFSGGNCAYSKPNELVEKNGVKIVGYNLINNVSCDASKLFAKNVLNFLSPHIANSTFNPNYEDDLIKGTLLSSQGSIVHSLLQNI